MRTMITRHCARLLAGAAITLPIASAHAWSFSQVYAFKGTPDAANPLSGLTPLNGTLYGIARGGADGAGAIYGITPAGAESVIYSFPASQSFVGDLAALNNVLYGATYLQGAGGAGSLYAVTLSGTETTLVSFGGHRDRSGAYPQAGMIPLGQLLYGTTLGGGADRLGVTFRLSPDGAYKVLHSFTAVATGYYPAAALLYQGGLLYGTTFYGGTGPCDNYYGGCGTIFSMTRAGAVTTLYSFAGGSDATNPASALIYWKGAFYGATAGGGANGLGAVYAYTPGAGEKVIYSFKGGSDGASPQAALVAAGSAIYGTTLTGGKGCAKQGGCGTVFEIATDGTEKIIHRFNGKTDGAFPGGRLIDVAGVLFGTTPGYDPQGNLINNGAIFKLSR